MKKPYPNFVLDTVFECIINIFDEILNVPR